MDNKTLERELIRRVEGFDLHIQQLWLKRFSDLSITGKSISTYNRLLEEIAITASRVLNE